VIVARRPVQITAAGSEQLIDRFERPFLVRLGFDGWSSDTYGEEEGPVHNVRREYGVGCGVSPFLQLRLAF
jgi:hypothetical protein